MRGPQSFDLALLTINGGILSFPPVLPHNIARFIMANITITITDLLKNKQKKQDSSYDQKVQSNKKPPSKVKKSDANRN